MEKNLIVAAQTYAARRDLHLAERLGFGIHGVVFSMESNTRPGRSAIKAHAHREFYCRERDIYQHLKEVGVENLLGFHIPRLLAWDDELCVIEMTVVTRPFVLDFAGAYLEPEAPPEFPDAVWEDWEATKREQFGNQWAQARAVLIELEALGISMQDVSPSNIAFQD